MIIKTYQTFDVALSKTEIESLEKLFDGKAKVSKTAFLKVELEVETAEKQVVEQMQVKRSA